jgi:glycosyltransferase involved in cell wall biosynthesis
MKIAVYNHGIAFDGTTPFNEPLGGSESGIVYMAQELARAGHDVTVYCNTPSPSRRGQRPLPEGEAAYRHVHQFFTDYTLMPWDVVISFRSFDPFLVGRVAPRMIYWTGDACNQPALENFEHSALQENIDLIFCVSDWHRRSFIDAFHLAPEKVIATRNGFCPELICRSSSRERVRCAYSSTPFRGLEILLKMFPQMRASNPDLQLDVFSSMKVYGWSREADLKAFGAIYDAAKQPGVTWHGSVAQPSLLKSLGRTGLFLYPNTFNETSCIAAIEAQASGCIVVTSAQAGLNETVQNGRTGICLQGDPKSLDYQQEFTQTVRQLLRSPSRMAEISEAATRYAFEHYTWTRIALEWTNIFESMPAKSVHSRWSGPLSLIQKTHEFLQKGNVTAASRTLAAAERTPFLKNEVEVLKGQLSTWM